mgnify:CR=1 FL=1
MVQIKLETSWQLGASKAEAVEAALFPLLHAIHESGSLAQAARALGLSYRHTWGLLGKWERQIGQPLAHLPPQKASLWPHWRRNATASMPAFDSSGLKASRPISIKSPKIACMLPQPW